MANRRGRPSFKPTPANRRTVERMLACGDTQNTIARALDIDEGTLKKHFADQLLNGAARRRRQVVDMVFNGAQKGNATLIKRAEEMSRVSVAAENVGAQFEPRQQPLGKKEQREEAARVAGAGRFATPSPPKLVVNNGG